MNERCFTLDQSRKFHERKEEEEEEVLRSPKEGGVNKLYVCKTSLAMS